MPGYRGRILTALEGAATPTEVASGTGDAQGVAATAGLRLVGFFVTESASSPDYAEVVIRIGTTAAGTRVGRVKLGPQQSAEFEVPNVAAAAGIFIDRVAGETELTLFTKVLT